jgi:hypothetical protein
MTYDIIGQCSIESAPQVPCAAPAAAAASLRRTQGVVEEELRAHIIHQAVPRQVEIGLDVERFYQIRIVGVGREYNNTVLLTTRNHMISYTIS